ncbi:MAG: phosphoribosyltransferase [Candidatus Korarchaeota archaeon]|nr:phosphoribosyltransferase [Candidatus Korarchaeota archaeon]NIU84929.1 phosphoribosyltransferase [Candidatus Thorarchaeota archaeon]NIW14946.1 phosphoribosyltransferase [Candidatus Thorarchaeota archaeon]NIW52913.1 phosphoribosyltransferase [Candidatus Korarchaeota archaeon]
MNNHLSFEVTDWKEIVRLSLKLSKLIRENSFSPDLIIGILKGGAVVSRIVSDFLGKELFTLKISFYEGIGQTGETTITQELNADVADKKVVIVDDIVDKGDTLALAFNYFQKKGAEEIRTGVLHRKPWTDFNPDFWVKETEKWVVYPWEHFEFLRLGNKKLNSNLGTKNKKRLKRAMQKVKAKIQEFSDM